MNKKLFGYGDIITVSPEEVMAALTSNNYEVSGTGDIKINTVKGAVTLPNQAVANANQGKPTIGVTTQQQVVRTNHETSVIVMTGAKLHWFGGLRNVCVTDLLRTSIGNIATSTTGAPITRSATFAGGSASVSFNGSQTGFSSDRYAALMIIRIKRNNFVSLGSQTYDLVLSGNSEKGGALFDSPIKIKADRNAESIEIAWVMGTVEDANYRPIAAYIEGGNAASSLTITVSNGANGEGLEVDFPNPKLVPYQEALVMLGLPELVSK